MMFSMCPKCQTKLSVEMKHLDEDTAIVCVGCRSVLKIRVVVEMIAESKKAASSAPKTPALDRETSQHDLSDAKKALICIDGEGTRDLIKEILTESRFKVVDVPSGKEVLSAVQQHQPVVALIDVGLSDVLGSELCDSIKKNPRLKGTVVILVAAIYDKNTKYRRQPDSLFGADDYIERHHIQNDLMGKIKKHLASPPQKKEFVEASRERSVPPRSEPGIPKESVIPVRRADPVPQGVATALKKDPVQQDSKEGEAAKRLARIIVSDVVLYNKKKVDEGIRTNTFFEVLKEEIEEGRKHYISRVPAEIQKTRDYYKEAFDEFIKKRKASS
jgi:CheY-like chemotaxis protein